MSRRRRSIWDIFDDMFREFDELLREFEEEFHRRFETAFAERAWKEGPYIYGFSITIGPDGRPIIREFGNVRRVGPGGRPKITEEWEPLIDVLEDDEYVTVVAEMPGVDKENIKIRVKDNTLIISAQGPNRKYYKEVPLPAKVKVETAKASYRNGVLEVKLEKLEKGKKEEGFEIKVE